MNREEWPVRRRNPGGRARAPAPEAGRGRREEEQEVTGKLRAAVEMLVQGMTPALVPEVGTNIAYALPGARAREDVAGVEGRIVLRGGKVHPVGGVAFGASTHMARVVLTAMRTDPSIRSAANIRFSPGTLAVLDDLLLEVCEFDRAREPPGVSTMEWGVAFCCRESVPDVIFDRGAVGKEPMIRILGEEPVGVAHNILKVSRCMHDAQG